jgi:hypothetical protein
MKRWVCTALFFSTMKHGLMLSLMSEYLQVYSLSFRSILYPTLPVNSYGVCPSLNLSRPQSKSFTTMTEMNTTWWRAKVSRACTSRALELKVKHGFLWLRKPMRNYMAIMNLWRGGLQLRRFKISQGKDYVSLGNYRGCSLNC